MKIRIEQIKLNIEHNYEDIKTAAARALKIPPHHIIQTNIIRKSIDARKKDSIKIIYCVDVIINKDYAKKINFAKIRNIREITEDELYRFSDFGHEDLKYPPVIVGSGPAGLFCTYLLTLHGYNPILIERGEDVDKRRRSVEQFWNTNTLNPNSNVQFGEGGAGTFSDGKLNTRTKDKFFRGKFVLETFVKNGAPENILYDSGPHIGTDILCRVIKNMRNEIINNGGKVLFETALTDIICDGNRLSGIEVNNTDIIKTDTLVLALGHSARDTFVMLSEKNIRMEQKPFAVGVRIEHTQQIINESQYGIENVGLLPPAVYKLTTKASDGRGVYSFCMCPGGYVVNASSEFGMLAINGMSYSGRDGENANSAIVVTISPKDFKSDSPLAGIEFQRELERSAYNAANGRIPQQRYGDFIGEDGSCGKIDIVTNTKGESAAADLNEVLPEFISRAIKDGIKKFGGVIEGFDDANSVISAIESRTSCPLRILRDENFESSIKGVYPCGEGAGYAGGIVSAAIDGIKVFEALAHKYKRGL